MRHRIKDKKFNRDENHRKALLSNLVRSLVEHGHVTTTEIKAKELRRLSDRLIHKAQTNTIATRQLIHRFFGKRDVVNTLVDRIAPLMTDRVSGFTTLTKLGKRKGDNSSMVTVTLVHMPAGMGTLKVAKTVEATAESAKAPAKVKAVAAAPKAAAKAKPAAKAPAKKKVSAAKAK